MEYAIAVVILIDDLMMHRRVDLEAGDALELILARERNPRLDMVGSGWNRDLRMIGETKIALPIGRRRRRSRGAAAVAAVAMIIEHRREN